MPSDVHRMLRLWTDPLPEDEAAAKAFRELYSDPVTANGAPLRAADLVTRTRAMQAALEHPEREVLSVVDAGIAVALAFRPAGRRGCARRRTSRAEGLTEGRRRRCADPRRHTSRSMRVPE